MACTGAELPVRDIAITKADGNVVMVRAEIARSEAERSRGFMERKKIPDGTGMLFLFERDQILHFWMKNTPTALSIAYIDYKGVIREIYDMKPFNLQSVSSNVSVRYALEVPQGWFTRVGIAAGDTVAVP
jgi:uncharacterized membrane protein (UPF0127 family)